MRGQTYQESLRLRKVQLMDKDEIIDYYRSGGEQLPDRFSDCEKAKQNEIISHYKPFKYSQNER